MIMFEMKWQASANDHDAFCDAHDVPGDGANGPSCPCVYDDDHDDANDLRDAYACAYACCDDDDHANDPPCAYDPVCDDVCANDRVHVCVYVRSCACDDGDDDARDGDDSIDTFCDDEMRRSEDLPIERPTSWQTTRLDLAPRLRNATKRRCLHCAHHDRYRKRMMTKRSPNDRPIAPQVRSIS